MRSHTDTHISGNGLNSVPGVPKGSFAMALKLHHCAVDGMASVQMIAALHDLAADGPRPAGPASPWRPGPVPSTADLLSRMAINAALHPLRVGTVLASSAPKAVRGLAALPGKLVGVASGVAGGSVPSFPPKTRFNQTVSPHRVFEARFHDLADFKRIKASVPGSTVNDVALAYVGGALRKYLDGHGELPDASLVAACPISMREAGDKTIRVARAMCCSAECQRSVRTSLIRSNGLPQSLRRLRRAVRSRINRPGPSWSI